MGIDDPIKDVMYALPNIPRELAVKFAKIPGIHVRANADCKGCGLCVRKGFCKIKAIKIVDKKAVVNDRLCRGCTRCIHMCPYDGLEMYGRAAVVLDTTKKHVEKHVEPVIDKVIDNLEKR